jgi:putative GTP pyrophosphokinase
MMELGAAYQERLGILEDLARRIEKQLQDYLRTEKRIDRISARPKSLDRFLRKAEATVDGHRKYNDPLNQIQDQVGARIITFYTSDIDRLVKVVNKYYRPIETKVLVPDHEWKFGYFGRHFILITPSDVVDRSWPKGKVPDFFELQIRTLFQHAWSEANHDLGYKPESTPLKPDSERKLAYTAAQAWGADQMFEELFSSQRSKEA